MPNGSSDAIKNHAAFIWSVADLLRGDDKQSEYGKVILPLMVLRRFDRVLAPVTHEMLDTHERLLGKVENFGPVLDQLSAVDGLWNISRFDIPKLLDDPNHIADNLRAHIAGFSSEAPATSTSRTVDPRTINWIMTGTDTFACEGTSHGVHRDGPWRAGVDEWKAGRWCDVFEVRDFLIQRCFIYLDPDYASKDTDRYPWLASDS